MIITPTYIVIETPMDFAELRNYTLGKSPKSRFTAQQLRREKFAHEKMVKELKKISPEYNYIKELDYNLKTK